MYPIERDDYFAARIRSSNALPMKASRFPVVANLSAFSVVYDIELAFQPIAESFFLLFIQARLSRGWPGNVTRRRRVINGGALWAILTNPGHPALLDSSFAAFEFVDVSLPK
ncbi:hypothetical protein HJB67_28975 [Rhizobium lentis]|uniref:hypothetical protein n=1 Tax=Rhizobium lentis TaxID=1138194 RepID=UPI001C83EB42|nr:hypothetical protein [Rhizobium lentis]MBX5013928.1 hypothetical protein [Rhizobium lentis]